MPGCVFSKIQVGGLPECREHLLQGDGILEIQVISAMADCRVRKDEFNIIPSAETGGDLFHRLAGELQFSRAPSYYLAGIDGGCGGLPGVFIELQLAGGSEYIEYAGAVVHLYLAAEDGDFGFRLAREGLDVEAGTQYRGRERADMYDEGMGLVLGYIEIAFSFEVYFARGLFFSFSKMRRVADGARCI